LDASAFKLAVPGRVGDGAPVPAATPATVLVATPVIAKAFTPVSGVKAFAIMKQAAPDATDEASVAGGNGTGPELGP
jgi:hypothetical protein